MTMPRLMVASINDVNSSFATLENLTLDVIPGEISDSVIDYSAQAVNLVLAGPSSGTTTAVPTWRALVMADLPDGTALSVLGRASNTNGDHASIVAANDAEVLRRSGTSVGFGTVATAGIADNAVTNGKIRDSAAVSVIGRSANSTGDPADIAAASNGQLLMRTSDTIAFGTTIQAAITFSPASGNDAINITAGQLESSSQFGTRLELTSSQSINTGTLTALANWGESFDRGGCHEGVTNPSRITVPTGGAGIWLFIAGIEWAAGGGARREIGLRFNGAGLMAYHQVTQIATVITWLTVATIYSVADADYMEAVVFQDSGAGLNASAGSATFFCGMKLF